MNLDDLLRLPASADAAATAHLQRDFRAMAALNGTAVRLLPSLDTMLLNTTAVNIGLGHIVALSHSSSTLYQIRLNIRYLYF